MALLLVLCLLICDVPGLRQTVVLGSGSIPSNVLWDPYVRAPNALLRSSSGHNSRTRQSACLHFYNLARPLSTFFISQLQMHVLTLPSLPLKGEFLSYSGNVLKVTFCRAVPSSSAALENFSILSLFSSYSNPTPLTFICITFKVLPALLVYCFYYIVSVPYNNL